MRTNLGQMYAVGVMAFILFLSTLVAVPVLPQLSVELGAGPAGVPIVVSAALATVVLVQFFTGILADRYSRQALILVGALLGAVSSLLCVVATDWVQLLVLRVIGGIADAIAMPALLALTASLGSDRPGRFFGILRSSQGLSFAVAPALGGLFSLVSLRTPFLVDGILSLLAFVAVFHLIGRSEKVASPHGLSLFRGLSSTFSNPRVYLYLLMGISGLFSFGILYSFVVTKAQHVGLQAWEIGAILSGGAIIFSLTSYLTGILADKLGRRVFVILSQLIVVTAGIGLAFSNNFLSLAAYYGLFCIGETVTYLLAFVYAKDNFDERYMATSMGAFDSMMDLSLFIGPLIAISVFKYSGIFAPVFLIAVAPAFLAFFATILWLPREAKSTHLVS